MAADPDAVIEALNNVGVDFSVPRPALVDFLGNEEFTPYPAMAEALLKLLNGRALRLPVFIDVIVFNYEHSPGDPSPRRLEDVDFDVLKGAVIEGFNNRHGEQNADFDSLLKPLDQGGQPPVQTLALVIEGSTTVQNGVTLVNTDNPRVEVKTKLIDVHADWANGMVPQELSRQGNQWRFTNGDAEISVSGGEANAEDFRPVVAGSLNEGALAWPTAAGQFGPGAEVAFQSRIRVAYRPVDVKLLIHGPKGFASNTAETARIALDPNILLVPVEVARFFSDSIPVANISALSQMALWDQVPVIGATTNFKSTDGATGELKFADRTWDDWPTLNPEGLYTRDGWVSPDSIWGKAGVRFRLVNFINIKTDNVHTNPVAGQGADDSRLRENNTTLNDHPQHIKDKPVVKVIFMHRIAPPDAPEIGRALIGNSCLGISAGAADKFATIAHEIGHLITGSQVHSNEPNNVMNDPGPGTNITDVQIAKAREWAQTFSGFWQR